MIPQNFIDLIIRDSDIVSIVNEYVPLKKAGANYKGLCPFHSEKTPSFVVSPQKQIYSCFGGCNKGGNVIGFIMEMDKISFPEAVEILADRLNIAMPQTHQKREDQQASSKEIFYKINSYAQWFFRNAKENSEIAENYIHARQISEKTSETFDLGFAPDSYNDLVKYLLSKKIPLDAAVKAGLLKQGDRSPYAFYRNRLIFPIRDVKGRIIGFGGRDLSGSSQAKYINSPESPIYNKSAELYGLYENRQAISQKETVLIVEGYIDAIACHQLGQGYAVALLGTALTELQVKKLKRFAKQFILLFDGDSAGRQAALRSIELCFNLSIHPKICILPKNSKDPGDLLEMPDGSEILKSSVEGAKDAMDWIFSMAMNQFSSVPSQKVKIIRSLEKWFKRLPDEIERLEYLKKTSQFFDIPLKDLEKTLEISSDSVTVGRRSDPALSLEERLVAGFTSDPDLFPNRSLSDFSNDFESLSLRRLAEEIEKIAKKHETFTAGLAISDIPQNLRGEFQRILLNEKSESFDFDTKTCIEKFKVQQNRKRLKRITAQIAQAEAENNTELKLKLLGEKQKLLVEKSRESQS